MGTAAGGHSPAKLREAKNVRKKFLAKTQARVHTFEPIQSYPFRTISLVAAGTSCLSFSRSRIPSFQSAVPRVLLCAGTR
jgi:hypothetical protein